MMIAFIEEEKSVMIAVCIAALALSGVDANQGIITTNPNLPENKLASNYASLLLSVQFEQQQTYSGCSWNSQSIGGEESFYNNVFGCGNVTNELAEVQCIQHGASITGTLRVTSPLKGNSESFSVICTTDSNPITIATRAIMIADCSTIPPLVANSASATYNSVGTFSCANGTLYYSNGTQPTSTQTICLATAEWSGQDGLECRQDCSINPPLAVNSTSTIHNAVGTFVCTNYGTLFYSNGTQPTLSQTTCLVTGNWSGQDGLECWKAPSNVNVIGELTVVEGNEINLKCDYTEGVPDVTNIIFKFNGTNFLGQKFKANLDRNHNQNPVYCEVANQFTEILSETGPESRSPIKNFNVLYAPFANASNVNVCNFSSEIFETSQNKPECDVVFYSNPNSTFVSVTESISGTKWNSTKNSIIIDGASGKHTFKFTEYTVTNVSSSTLYNLTVHVSEVPPYNHFILFTVNIDAQPATTTLPSPAVNDTLTYVIIAVVVVIGTALIVVLVLCLTRRRSVLAKTVTGPANKIEVEMQEKIQQTTSTRTEDLNGYMTFEDHNKPVYEKIDDNENLNQNTSTSNTTSTRTEDPNGYMTFKDQSKSVYEKIGGNENLAQNTSTSNQQLEDTACVNASTAPYINLRLEQESSTNSSYQNFSIDDERNSKKLHSTKPENNYEMMN